MRSFKMIAPRLSAFVIPLLVLAACVKPQNHDSALDNSASFTVSEVKATMATESLFEGFSIPKSRRYTFTACLKDNRTQDSLPGVSVEVASGLSEPVQTVSADKDGCVVWNETLAFDFLANETYLSVTRTLRAQGLQTGSRTLKLALNPWALSVTAPPIKDLNYDSVPSSQIALENFGSTPRRLHIESLPLKNSSSSTTDGSLARVLEVDLKPVLMLTNIEGISQAVALDVKAGRLSVNAVLIESRTSGGQETRSVIDRIDGVLVQFEDGHVSAKLPLKIREGTNGSRFLLALQVLPVDGPKGLLPFEGLFSIGDLKSLTENGSSSGELKSSNADATVTFAKILSSAGAAPEAKADGKSNSGVGSSAPSKPSSASRQVRAFSISRIEPTWSAVAGGVDVTNKRTIMYRVKACIADLSNGGRPAVDTEFQIQLANKSWVTRQTTTLNQFEGCVEWEDTLTHLYYQPERFHVIPVTFKHKSGFVETRTYAIDPWQSFRFSADAAAQPEMIEAVNNRAKVKSRLMAESLEFNSTGSLRYDVDDYLALTVIKKVLVRVPLRVMRASNVVEGINSGAEPLRQGRYLLKAAFVAPLMSVTQKKAELLVSPMIGLTRIVDVRAGELKASLEFPVSDIRLMNSRSYLALELYLIDETKLPANDPYLLKSKIDPMTLIDRNSNLITPTFVGALNMRSEKDSAILVTSGDLGIAAPLTDRINSIAMRSTPVMSASNEPLANITVDRLYAVAKNDREIYRARMNAERSLGLMAIRANADLVFVNNEAANAGADPMIARANRALAPAKSALTPLLTNLNARLDKFGATMASAVYRTGMPQVTRESLSKLIRGAQPFNIKLATQFCGYFFGALPRSKVSGLKLSIVEAGSPGAWMNACIDQVVSGGPDSAFSVDHRIRVLKTDRADWIRGRSLDVRLGASVGFAKSESGSRSFSYGFGTSGVLGELSKRALLGQGNRALKIFTAAAGISGVGADVTRSDSTSASISGGYGFDIGQVLSIEQNELRVNVTESDECIIMRPKPAMFETYRSSLYMGLLRQTIGTNEADQIMNRGLMICNGAVSKVVRQLPERYYTFGIQLSGGNALDARNINNLPWLFTLRGQRDYASFLVLASGQKTSVAQAKTDAIDLGDLPLSRLQDAYDKHFRGKLASIPGYITNEPKILYRRVPAP